MAKVIVPDGRDPDYGARVLAKPKYEPQAKWKGGVRLRLTEKEKKVVEGLEEKGSLDLSELLVVLGDNGIKTSIWFDRDQGSYTVSLFRNRPGYQDAGYSIATSSRYIDRCFRSLLFVLEDVRDFDIVAIHDARTAVVSDY